MATVTESVEISCPECIKYVLMNKDTELCDVIFSNGYVTDVTNIRDNIKGTSKNPL